MGYGRVEMEERGAYRFILALFLTGDWKVPRTRRQECLRYMTHAGMLARRALPDLPFVKTETL